MIFTIHSYFYMLSIFSMNSQFMQRTCASFEIYFVPSVHRTRSFFYTVAVFLFQANEKIADYTVFNQLCRSKARVFS